MTDPEARKRLGDRLADFGWAVGTGLTVTVVGGTAVYAVTQSRLGLAATLVAALGVGLAIIKLLSTVVDLQRRLDAAERRAAVTSAELDVVRSLIEPAYRAALPQWLRVAIRHAESEGKRVELADDNLRFVDERGYEIYLVPLPVPAAVGTLHHHELHSRLGIGQREYIAALLRGDAHPVPAEPVTSEPRGA
jgi:hypothetical protein